MPGTFLGHFEIDDSGWGMVQVMQSGNPAHPNTGKEVNVRIWKNNSGSPAIVTTLALDLTDSAHSVSISAASAANPCVLTVSTDHGIKVGDRIYISASGTDVSDIHDIDHLVTAVGATSITLETDGSNISGFSSGTLYLSGLFFWSYTLSTANGFAAGNVYFVSYSTTVGGATPVAVGGGPDSFMVN